MFVTAPYGYLQPQIPLRNYMLAGEPVDMGWFQNWLTMIREATREGRQINQGFFKKLWIGEDGSVVRAEPNEPFRAMFGDLAAATSAAVVSEMDRETRTAGPAGATTGQWYGLRQTAYTAVADVTPRKRNTTHRDIACSVRGVNEFNLVAATGIEPVT